MEELQLKRLEAYGFKSFADKIEIEFHPGITAIVGPNGSGKSNITDAIRWVLGEQNIRTLRGAKTEDIIFAGSSTRKQLGVAEVSLFFDNDGTLPLDYREVVVTRRLYRSGESEFQINGSRCRLKDIHQMFADTGLGHGSMSIIGQNRIDSILNSKPEERCVFFEEAAGISKFRARRKESERKLSTASDNLVRVGDILQEIETQMEPLGKSAERTRTYSDLKKRLSHAEVSDLSRKADRLVADEDKLSEKRQKAEDEEAFASANMEGAEARKAQLDSEAMLIEQELRKSAEEYANIRDKATETKNEAAQLKERENQLQASYSRLGEERKETEAEDKREAAAMSEMIKKKDICLQDSLRLEKEIAESEQSAEDLHIEIGKQKEWMSKLRAKADDAQAELLSRQSALKMLEHDIDENEKSSARSDETIAALESEARIAWEAARDADSKLQALLARKAELESSKESLRMLSARAEKRSNEAATKLRTHEQRFASVSQKEKLLMDMQNEYEGFGHGVKAVLSARESWSKGVAGAVAELIDVPHEYVTAIEIALGGQMQNVVTDNAETAKAAIGYLKRTHAGRVTFLPLSSIVVKSPVHQVSPNERDGVLGYANKLVTPQKGYAKIADFLLGRTIVTDTLDHAIMLSKREGQRQRIVTLDGSLISPGGAMSGGSRKQKGMGWLDRSSEISKLRDTLKDLKEKIDVLKKTAEDSVKESQELASRCSSNEDELGGVSIEAAEAQVMLGNLEKSAQEKLDKLADEKKASVVRQESFATVEKRRTDLKHAIDEAADLVKEQQDALKMAEEELDDMQDDEDQQRSHIARLQLHKAVAEKELAHAKEGISEAGRAHDMRAARMERQQQEMDKAAEELAKCSARLRVLRSEDEKYAEMADNAEALRQDRYKERMEKLAESQKMDKEAHESARKRARLEKSIHEIDIALSEKRMKRTEFEERLMTDFGMTPEEARAQAGNESDEELTAQITSLRSELEELGPVNPNAVEEYEALSSRHDFLKKQSDDLIKGRNNLEKLISEIDDAMTKEFKKAFADIQAYFQESFAALFGGGNAELSLSGESVLEAGIEISVQPPDKKRQNLSVLSGGERTLTVIALLFAFLRYRPSPFSVLDEIDAPLDDANIARFGKFLKEYAKHTQFIVVTHRRGTMEQADYLYGVTMEDAGVSRLVSVRLDTAGGE